MTWRNKKGRIQTERDKKSKEYLKMRHMEMFLQSHAWTAQGHATTEELDE